MLFKSNLQILCLTFIDLYLLFYHSQLRQLSHNQVGVTHILKSSLVCHNSCLFTCTFFLPTISLMRKDDWWSWSALHRQRSVVIFHYIITYLIFSVSFSFCNWVIPEKNIKKTEGDMGGSGGGSVGRWSFQGCWRTSMWSFQGQWLIEKGSESNCKSRGDHDKIMWNFRGFWVLILEFPKGVIQLCGIFRGEALFCPEFPR